MIFEMLFIISLVVIICMLTMLETIARHWRGPRSIPFPYISDI